MNAQRFIEMVVREEYAARAQVLGFMDGSWYMIGRREEIPENVRPVIVIGGE